MLTTPVSVASAECSFFKLKLIKNDLRLTMQQGKLEQHSHPYVVNRVWGKKTDKFYWY